MNIMVTTTTKLVDHKGVLILQVTTTTERHAGDNPGFYKTETAKVQGEQDGKHRDIVAGSLERCEDQWR